MKSTVTFLFFISLFKCFLGQADEFTFGGLEDDEEERIFNVTFITSDDVTMSQLRCLSVVCIASNSTIMGSRTRWHDQNRRVLAPNNSIFIRSVHNEIESPYYCTLRYYRGKHSERLFNLTVTVPTIPIENLANVTLQVGATVLRQCFNFQLGYTFGNPKFREAFNQYNSDIGKYFCEFKSKETSQIYEARAVSVSTGFIGTSPFVLKIREGEKVKFRCQAWSLPNFKNTDVKWRFQTKDESIKYDIPDSRWTLVNPGFDKDKSSISLNVSQVLDSGYYICIDHEGRTAMSELIVIPEAIYLTITPKKIHVRPGQTVAIECHSKNPQGRPTGLPQFYFTDKVPNRRDSRFAVSPVEPGHIRLSAPSGLSLSDNNMAVYCTSGDRHVTATIYVNHTCPPGYRYCQNGHCLETSKFYDKVVDCVDGSDENLISCSLGRQSNVRMNNMCALLLPIGVIFITKLLENSYIHV